MPIPFTKLQGLGNDYVYLDAVAHPELGQRNDYPVLARRMSDRHFGIGSDGLIVILPGGITAGGERYDVRMRMFNADGSESEMCGNGLRCVVKYAVDHGLVDASTGLVAVLTGAGLLRAGFESGTDAKVAAVTLDMGRPGIGAEAVGADAERLETLDDHDRTRADGAHDAVYRLWLDEKDQPPSDLDVTLISMGNPHAVCFVEDVAAVDLDRLGPAVERHPAFPARINAHFAQVLSPREVRMRTWERGSGPTLACGTGATAVAVAAALRGLTQRAITVHLPGGALELSWDASTGHVMMRGPAIEVFSGVWYE